MKKQPRGADARPRSSKGIGNCRVVGLEVRRITVIDLDERLAGFSLSLINAADYGRRSGKIA
jgi:hypothetical protein